MNGSGVSVQFSAMGTTCLIHGWIDGADHTITLDVLHLLAGRVSLLEQSWTRFSPDSELNHLNATAGSNTHVPVSRDLFHLVSVMKHAYEMTDGLFDPTQGQALIDHGYDRTYRTMPAMWATAIPVPVKAATGMNGVLLDEKNLTVLLPDGVRLDPGGIGKGLAGDILIEEIRLSGIPMLGLLVDLGGDIVLAGAAGEDPWVLSVRDERHPSETPIAMLEIPAMPFSRQAAVATSTTLTRTWSAAGVPRHHILDPNTSQPADSETVQVTVVTECGWAAEASATAALLLNRDGEAWLHSHHVPGLLGQRNGTVHVVETESSVSPSWDVWDTSSQPAGSSDGGAK